MNIDSLLERDLLPDFVIRAGIRRLLKQRLQEEAERNNAADFIRKMNASPIALQTQSANEQHYEVPTEFFQLVLGKHLKYSSAYWNNGQASLDEAELEMLKLTCDRAQLANAQSILELGCGWGSLSLFMAEHFPGSKIISVSNSKTQKEFIDRQIATRAIKNLQIITADMNSFDTDQHFDRVVSVEMFEHMRNYRKLMEKIASFLKEDGKLFIHIFSHARFAYAFEIRDQSDWMAKYFFSGGMMPSDQLLYSFQEQFQIEEHWRVNGHHYEKTAQAWLQNMDRNRETILNLFQKFYGVDEAKKWWSYWRIFFMSCAELWGYKDGNEWLVSHYLLKRI
jgi:cyclopropane-fatty-acyl-phospholipid synthase